MKGGFWLLVLVAIVAVLAFNAGDNGATTVQTAIIQSRILSSHIVFAGRDVSIVAIVVIGLVLMVVLGGGAMLQIGGSGNTQTRVSTSSRTTNVNTTNPYEGVSAGALMREMRKHQQRHPRE